jgi:hypothetical protein
MVQQQEVKGVDLGEVVETLRDELNKRGALKKQSSGAQDTDLIFAVLATMAKHGETVMDLAWLGPKGQINHYDEEAGEFLGGFGQPVEKKCRVLTLANIPKEWSPRP